MSVKGLQLNFNGGFTRNKVKNEKRGELGHLTFHQKESGDPVLRKGLFISLRPVHTELRQRQRQLKYFSVMNGLHGTLWKCSHGDLRRRQRQPIGSNTIHSFRCRCRSQCERAFSVSVIIPKLFSGHR